jgi:hypothetical protein
MFKDWEEMKLLSGYLIQRMDEKNAKDLNYWLRFTDSLAYGNRKSFFFPILRRAVYESGLWKSASFREWIKKELEEMKDMIEYYGENEDE